MTAVAYLQAFNFSVALAQTLHPVESRVVEGNSQPLVIPPRLVMQPSMPYPDGGKGDVTVVLTVTVNGDGSVSDAQPLNASEPFGTAATEYVKNWLFAPATRDGIPIAARIRLKVAFYEHIAKTPETEASKLNPSLRTATYIDDAPSKTVTQTVPTEVTVSGEKRNSISVSLSRNEVRQIPGTFGDPFRAIELLPGVTPIMSALPYFYVRGAPPGNTGYYLDGIRVPYLYHIAVGPSVIHPGLVERVELYSGGYPAQFGRYAGGIVSARTTAATPTTHGEGSVRLFDAGALVETGYAQGRGTVLLSGRYSYTAALISIAANGVGLDYRDFQTRVTYDVTTRDRVSTVAFGSYDLLTQKKNVISTLAFGSEFYRVDTRWDHRISGGGSLRTAITLGYDQTAIGGQRNVRDRMFGVRSELEKPLGEHLRFRIGIDTIQDAYLLTRSLYEDPNNPKIQRFQDLFPTRTDLVMGVSTELGIEVQKGFTVTPGIRADYFLSGGATAIGVDPRLLARLNVTKRFTFVQAYGIAHQPPSFILPIPGLAVGSLANGLQTSYQSSAGIEWIVAERTLLTSNVFNNVFENTTDVLSVSEAPEAYLEKNLNQRAQGRSYGLEVFLHRPMTQRFGGILSYTLSRSTRRLDNSESPSAFDRRHVANAAIAYDLGRHWRAGTRLVFYTGAPKQANMVTTGTTTKQDSSPPRDPAAYRIDLRLEKLWRYSENRHLAFVIECLNATMRKEIINGTAVGPIFIPSVGVEGTM